MKKTLLAIIPAILILIGCNEKKLLGDVEGSWKVKKYTYNDVDKTATFDTTFAEFRWNFNADKTYTQTWKSYYIDHLISYDTTWATDTAGVSYVSNIDTVETYPKVTVPNLTSGTWMLINSNKFIETIDSTATKNQYRIDKHSSKSLELFKGNETWQLESI